MALTGMDDSSSSYSLSRLSNTDVGIMVSTAYIACVTCINFVVFMQGLRDLVLSVNSQTQAMLASMSYSLQNISTDVLSLREQMRRPGLKKKKVYIIIIMFARICRHGYN